MEVIPEELALLVVGEVGFKDMLHIFRVGREDEVGLERKNEAEGVSVLLLKLHKPVVKAMGIPLKLQL